MVLGDHPVERRLKFQGHGKQFTLHLKKKDHVPEKLKVISQTRGTDLDFFRDYPVDNCFYEGKVMDEEGGESHVPSVSMCDDGFRGDLQNFFFRISTPFSQSYEVVLCTKFLYRKLLFSILVT